MTLAPNPEYHSPAYRLSIFDVRVPGGGEELHRSRAIWQGLSDIEAIDEDHYVLSVRADDAAKASR